MNTSDLLRELAEVLNSVDPDFNALVDEEGDFYFYLVGNEYGFSYTWQPTLPDVLNGDFVMATLDLLEEWGWRYTHYSKGPDELYGVRLTRGLGYLGEDLRGATRAEAVARALLHAAKARTLEEGR